MGYEYNATFQRLRWDVEFQVSLGYIEISSVAWEL
jgi:hypothetical protein